MAAVQSRMIALGTTLPAFSLPDTVSGKTVSSADYAGKPLVIAFICNHCPFVLHVADAFAAFARDYQARGLSVVAISSNDVATYPQDGPDKMKDFAAQKRFSFPYLYDEIQNVAQAYQAVCTPDFFLFDKDGKLAYRGQFDESRPRGEVKPTGADLRAAADAVLSGQAPSAAQKPSIGCNLKWKAGAEPEWA
jgi:peroxiredoxin